MWDGNLSTQHLHLAAMRSAYLISVQEELLTFDVVVFRLLFNHTFTVCSKASVMRNLWSKNCANISNTRATPVRPAHSMTFPPKRYCLYLLVSVALVLRSCLSVLMFNSALSAWLAAAGGTTLSPAPLAHKYQANRIHMRLPARFLSKKTDPILFERFSDHPEVSDTP